MMKSKLLNSLILAAFAIPGVAMADTAPASPFSGNVSLVSQYLYRGVAQTNYKPAIQGGFDYVNPNGFYAGTWGSSISWLTDGKYYSSSSLELDTYAGYSASFATDYTYNVGFLRYNYPGEYTAPQITANTNELYGSIGWKMLSAKYSRSFTNLFGTANSSGSSYLELNATYTLEGPAVDLAAHYGKQTVAGAGNDTSTYSDFNVKASKTFSGYTYALLLSKLKGSTSGVYSNKAERMQAVLSLSHSM
jgi:uncharacterized protein (TIGR02001 family)